MYTEKDEVVDAVLARGESWVYDLARERGQELDSVKHMGWFRELIFESVMKQAELADQIIDEIIKEGL